MTIKTVTPTGVRSISWTSQRDLVAASLIVRPGSKPAAGRGATRR